MFTSKKLLKPTAFIALFGFLPVTRAAIWHAAAPPASCDTNYSTCGSSGSPCCSIQHAVDHSSDGDTVLVAAGTYTPTGGAISTSKLITLKSEGDDPPLTRAEGTIILGTISLHNGSSNTGRRIEGFTISSDGTGGYGDGILSASRSVEIVGNIIEDNVKKGINVSGGTATIVIEQCIIQDNGDTGAYLETLSSTIGDKTQFNRNGLSGLLNSGIFLDGGDAVIDDCTFEGNSGDLGGAISSNTLGSVQIISSSFTNNSADDSGGAVYANRNNTLLLVNLVIQGNVAARSGGGILVTGDPSAIEGEPCDEPLITQLDMQNCLITCNTANKGGGIFVSNRSRWHVVNTTIAHNSTASYFLSAQLGGAIRTEGSCGVVDNAILWDNTAPTDPEISVGVGSAIQIGWSIVEGGLSCTGAFDCTGPVLNSDPLFVDDTDPCTGDENFRLSGSSPGIDSASNSAVLADLADLDEDCPGTGCLTEPTPLDLDMSPRFVDDPTPDTGEGDAPIVDMGPYESLRCPLGSITGAIPASGRLDARQPHPTSDNDFTSRQGIGSPNTYTDGPEPITIELDVSGATALDCWTLCETDIEPMEGGTLDVNYVESVTEVDSGVYEILLDRPISAGEWTTIQYFGGGDYVEYKSLPADVNNSGMSSSADILQWIDCCYNSTCAGYSKFRCDLNHSGAVTMADYLTLIDLLNGANDFIIWSGVSLASNCCPSGCGDSLARESSNQSTDDGLFANWIVSYLAGANPQDDTTIEEFHVIVSGLTQWCLDHIDSAQNAFLATELTDPGLTFVSKVGAEAAVNMAATLNP